MTVDVLLFAAYAEVLGRERLSLVMPASTTAGDVLRAVLELAGERPLPPSPLLAVNERYAPSGQALLPGDLVAIIPPVAGG